MFNTDSYKSPTGYSLTLYGSGCLIFSMGAYLFIHSNLGTDPLDTFALGLREHMPMTIGIAQTLVAILCLFLVAVWTKTRVMLSPLITFFFCGSMIDGQMAVNWAQFTPLHTYAAMIAGGFLCAYGSALIIMSNFGIRAIDLLALTMSWRRGIPFWIGKGLIEGSLFLIGWLLGGPVGVGTVCFFIMVDGLIQPMILINIRLFHLCNHAAPARQIVTTTSYI